MLNLIILLVGISVIYSIRLAGVPEESNTLDTAEGRVEIKFQGRWGTVCSDGWDDVDAAVVCNELGFIGQSKATVGIHGRGSGAIWLDDVDCRQGDRSLASCFHGGWGVHNCTHSQDAGVKCSTTNNSETGNFREPH